MSKLINPFLIIVALVATGIYLRGQATTKVDMGGAMFIVAVIAVVILLLAAVNTVSDGFHSGGRP